MGLRTLGYIMVCVMLLFLVAMVDSANHRPEVKEEKLAKEAWIRCRKHIGDNKGFSKDCDLYNLLQSMSESESSSLARKSMHNVIRVMPIQMKRELLHCVRNKNLLSDDFADGGSSSTRWLIECFRIALKCPISTQRRYMSSKRNVKTALNSLSPVTSQSDSPAISIRSQAYGSTPPSLHESSLITTSHYNPLGLLFYEANLHQRRELESSSTPSVSDSKKKRKKHKKKSKEEIERQTLVAIIATSVATFLIVAVLFCCWICLRNSEAEINYIEEKRDERPLLHLRDSFASSSLASASMATSSANDPKSIGVVNATLVSNLSMQQEKQEGVTLEGQSSETKEIAGDELPPLKPPPGRTVAPPPPAAPAPPPPRPPPPGAPGPPAPPKPRPPPPPKSNLRPSPLGPKRPNKSGSNDDGTDDGGQKTKLKPFFWDKVMASPNQSMVWHEISGGSFQFDEEMIESLFGYNANKNNNERKREVVDNSVQYIQIIDPRKAQNLSILLKALNVTTEEVLDALREANELPVELLQTLLKMAPTADEELKLRLYAGEIAQLGPAERFLKALVEVPFAFKRIESLVFMSSLQEEVTTLKEAFVTLEVASNKLKNSRLFLKLLEAVLKTGNRMNDGTYRGGALAFKLDTLLKLSDVKGTDGKTTLLHFVVLEIIRSEGIRAVRAAKANASVSSVMSDDLSEDPNDKAAEEHYCNIGLQVVSSLSNDFDEVKKAAVLDADMLSSTLGKLRKSLTKAKAFVESDMKSDEESEFYAALVGFMNRADSDIAWLSEEEKRITALVQSTADYFHGKSGKEEGLRLFSIVRSFLTMLDKACKEVKEARVSIKKDNLGEASSSGIQQQQQQVENQNHHKRLFPAIAERRNNESSSSDDENSSDED
ncbi:unnamed protein product [Linum tenue]|uniref:Formin-like protein n=1 Tax=Linum tenue TaxID=586396 RepID=A0AAV0R1J9_9ROSI|nr:unnamed protein product [Linum tenue]